MALAPGQLLAGVGARPLGELADYLRSPDDVLIYHHSIGCDWGVRAVTTRNCNFAVKYHGEIVVAVRVENA